jgi:pyrimidine operon attenuation protein/uracil phosphoribosyltransferase
MTLKASHQLVTADEMRQLLEAMARQIARVGSELPVVLLGIERRGAPLAERLARLLGDQGVASEPGRLDINLYRDDLALVDSQPVVRKTVLPVDIRQRDVVLVDDVLFTGRTIRSALEALNDYGRARSIRLAVLIDRGRRELPIQPDIVGRSIDSRPDEVVEVRVSEVDEEDGVWVVDRPSGSPSRGGERGAESEN